MIAEIAALTERFAIRLEQHDGLQLRKSNRIKTIYSSLAIEGNTLNEEQVSDIINGHHVIAPLRELQEVKNAIATYDLFESLDPFSLKDLLRAHKVMMNALVDEPGILRRGGVGVFSGEKAIHIAPTASMVSGLLNQLFKWLKKADDHLLIRSCVFHYEFEFIHPFTDGNGRMGRLWQSLILSKYNPIFQHLPVETIVHDNQQAYYSAINASSARGNCEPFIDFMLEALLHALKSHRETTLGGVNGGVSGGVNELLDYIIAHPGCRANQLSIALSLPQRTIERHLKALKTQGKLEFRGASRNGGYYVI